LYLIVFCSTILLSGYETSITSFNVLSGVLSGSEFCNEQDPLELKGIGIRIKLDITSHKGYVTLTNNRLL